MGLPVSDFVIFSGASVAMIMELIPLPVDDNVSIPLSAGLAMAVLGSTV
jgi:dolichol kinase